MALSNWGSSTPSALTPPSGTTRRPSAASAMRQEGADPSDLFELGKYYDAGRVALKDSILAAALFHQTPDKGQRNAQAWLAHMPEKGEGVIRDSVEA